MFLPWLTPSSLPSWTPPFLFSLYLFRLSLKTVFNRWTTGQHKAWTVSGMRAAYFSSDFRSYTILNFCWHGFSKSWQATQGIDALFLPNMPKYSIAVSLWSGQCCCFGSMALSCVSLWQARWLSPAKVIALLRHKYSTSHTTDKDFCFLPRQPGLECDSCFGSKCMSLYYLPANNNSCFENVFPKWTWEQKDEQREKDSKSGSIGSLLTPGKQTLHYCKHWKKGRQTTIYLSLTFLLWTILVCINEAHKRISFGFKQLPSCRDFGRTPEQLFLSLFNQNQSRLAQDYVFKRCFYDKHDTVLHFWGPVWKAIFIKQKH